MKIDKNSSEIMGGANFNSHSNKRSEQFRQDSDAKRQIKNSLLKVQSPQPLDDSYIESQDKGFVVRGVVPVKPKEPLA